jgi:hypothetical protein
MLSLAVGDSSDQKLFKEIVSTIDRTAPASWERAFRIASCSSSRIPMLLKLLGESNNASHLLNELLIDDQRKVLRFLDQLSSSNADECRKGERLLLMLNDPRHSHNAMRILKGQ